MPAISQVTRQALPPATPKPRSSESRLPVLASSLGPVQFRRRVPEIALVAAVLENAVRSLERQNGGVTREQVEETLAWIGDDRQDTPFAFVNVCEILGMDALRVRQNLRAVGLSNLEDRRVRVLARNEDADEEAAR